LSTQGVDERLSVYGLRISRKDLRIRIGLLTGQIVISLCREEEWSFGSTLWKRTGQ